ncbi:cytochrome P450 [Streptosporangium nondiastaticum]|uniref:Cytochrome P450 n=1 Tax=Streptosporangium nondiastaticum TaxID=35764 RepID=A0A9X7JV45_9ACTN|nr:cytochrome P450 [Streptosporangium nondiastaticum]PSJ30350.1 cytochrome P450 [Streptosporangium nondiastaticum]
MTTTAVSPAGLTDPGLHAHGDPHAVWRWMRAHDPVHRHQEAELPAFWSLTRHEDIRSVYRDAAGFSSARGVLLRSGDDPGGGMTLALSDAPRHRQLRGLMADWFHTRAVRGLEGYVRAATRSVLGRALELGECDFAHDVAGRLSLSVICHILGIPERDHEDLYRWTNEAFEAHRSLVSHPLLVEYFMELLYQRMEEPTDDLVSSLVNGTVDGELLTEEEAVFNCENLIGATENGRLALIGGMQAFLEHPDQWQRLADDRSLMPGAVEEVLRWTSSATHSMRVATRPHEIRGARIEAGDRVVLWLPSGNRDEEVFTDPYRFDVSRSPNRHIALATGEHVCIGGTLARAEMRVLFTELLDGVGRIEQSGPVRRLRSIEVNGPESLPVRLTAK